jgi:hypothetical protein
MSDASNFNRRQPDMVERITRSEAERRIIEILGGIAQVRLPPLPDRNSAARKVFDEAKKLSYTITTRSFIETLHILKYGEFLDFFYFTLYAGRMVGIVPLPSVMTFVIQDTNLLNEKNRIIVMVFSRSKQKLAVTNFDNVNDTSEKSEYNASDRVTTPANPGLKTTTPNRGLPKNYYPKRFPDGFWTITRKEIKNNFWEGTKVLKTNASQIVNVYKLVVDEATKENTWVLDGQQEDAGYNIHAGGKTWMDATDGCIRVETSTIDVLANLYDNKGSGGMMYLVVED